MVEKARQRQTGPHLDVVIGQADVAERREGGREVAKEDERSDAIAAYVQCHHSMAVLRNTLHHITHQTCADASAMQCNTQ